MVRINNGNDKTIGKNGWWWANGGAIGTNGSNGGDIGTNGSNGGTIGTNWSNGGAFGETNGDGEQMLELVVVKLRDWYKDHHLLQH